MNEKLIQFIELCIADGIVSEKEREVIFKKASEYNVPEVIWIYQLKMPFYFFYKNNNI